MRDLSAKMAELKFEAPLAQFEEITDDWNGPNDTTTTTTTTNQQQQLSINNQLNNNNLNNSHNNSGLLLINNNNNNNGSKKYTIDDVLNEDDLLLNNICQPMVPAKQPMVVTLPPPASAPLSSDDGPCAAINNTDDNIPVPSPPPPKQQPPINNAAAETTDNFAETFTGSLEDLVNTFDEKITKCFGNYEESVENLAPVQIRSQEEIMNECQMWWTITGNFGNILPIDWSKSYARKLHLSALNISDKQASTSSPDDDYDLSSEDEAVANDLDMHKLILGSPHQDQEPLKTADEVIREIDDMIMMQDENASLDASSMGRDESSEMLNDALGRAKEMLGSPLYEDKLRELSLSQLNELFMELEILIREFSETLIQELALRDELEYEKELKNTFISLLLSVQNKRRQYHMEKKKMAKNASNGNKPAPISHCSESKYLTTVIPYHLDSGPPDNQTVQILIKILKAINEDSPTVPTLLTDYILKVICPT